MLFIPSFFSNLNNFPKTIYESPDKLYIISVDFDQAVFLYNRKVMKNHPREEFREFSKNYITDFLENIENLAKSNTLYKNVNSRLIWITPSN